MGETFDVKSVMDVLYGENPSHKDSKFIFADDGKQKLREGECIRSSENGSRNYSSFWRNKSE